MCNKTFYGNRITRQWAQIALATAFGPLSLVNADLADPNSRLVPTGELLAENAVLAKALGQIDKMFSDWKLPTPQISYVELATLVKADSTRYFLTFAFPNAVKIQMIIDAMPAEAPDDFDESSLVGTDADTVGGPFPIENDDEDAPDKADALDAIAFPITKAALPDLLQTYWMHIS